MRVRRAGMVAGGRGRGSVGIMRVGSEEGYGNRRNDGGNDE